MSEAWYRMRDRLSRRKRAYQQAFPSPLKNPVLVDLARFCRANETCFHTDPRLHAVLEGRREVFLRICQHLHLDSQQLMEIYGARIPGVDDDG